MTRSDSPQPRSLRVHRLGAVEPGDAERLIQGFERMSRQRPEGDDHVLLFGAPGLGDGRFERLRVIGWFGQRPALTRSAWEESLARAVAEHGVRLRREGERLLAGSVEVGQLLPSVPLATGIRIEAQLEMGLPLLDLSERALEPPRGLAQCTHRPLLWSKVEASIVRGLARWSDLRPRDRRPDRRTISISILRRRGEAFDALLLFRHPHRGGFWQQVTGTQERGEAPEQTAQREFDEETGIPGLELVSLGYRHSFAFEGRGGRVVPRIFEETAFAALVEGDPPIRLDATEHEKWEWVDFDEAQRRVPHLGLQRGLRLAARRFSLR